MTSTNGCDQAAHRRRLVSLLFQCRNGLMPQWLADQARACECRYSGLRTTPEFQAALRSFSARRAEPFELFVIGEGKFGKSTLINALLGDEVCRVNILPETQTFHRLVLSARPSPNARLFVRMTGSEHDWLRRELGRGRPSDGFFEIDEYRLPIARAHELLAREAEIARRLKGPYSGAILELEEEIPWSPSSPFPERVRIVDTQGLNQQLPGDLAEVLSHSHQGKTPNHVVKWLHQSVRGRHLLWQYRRCDAVLWLLHATEVQSAATNVLFPIFSAYGKKTVLVITHVDRLRPAERSAVISCARPLYEHRTDAIVAVSAKLALEGRPREAAEESSGLKELRGVIDRLCVVDGLRTRAVGMYNALRATERDLRDALAAYRSDVEKILGHLADHRRHLDDLKRTALGSFENEVDAAAARFRVSLDARIRMIGLTSGAEDADRTIGFSALCLDFQRGVQAAVGDAERAIGDLVREMQREPYALPAFDAKGRRSGTTLSVQAAISFKRYAIRFVDAHVSLDRQYFAPLLSWLKTLLGVFSKRAREQGRLDLEQMRHERWSCPVKWWKLNRGCS